MGGGADISSLSRRKPGVSRKLREYKQKILIRPRRSQKGKWYVSSFEEMGFSY
jgi:hypothetical protein